MNLTSADEIEKMFFSRKEIVDSSKFYYLLENVINRLRSEDITQNGRMSVYIYYKRGDNDRRTTHTVHNVFDEYVFMDGDDISS